jgi:DNA-nicking Smr family endonuclease
MGFLSWLLGRDEGRAPDEPIEDEDEPFVAPETIEMPIDGVLDLHNFSPKDLGSLVPDYLAACRDKDILAVRIIHGKGTGALRKSVHALLDRSDIVAGYKPADVTAGGWGATLVDLKPRDG